VLAAAVQAYVDKTETAAQFALVRDYCQYYIEAPCWRGGAVEELRRLARAVTTREELQEWRWDAFGEGFIPF
jgi:hypothetical protein